MPDNNKKISFLKRLDFKKIFYPSASVAFALVIVVIFFFSVRFIAASIDKIFYEPSDSEIASQMVSFDRANYAIVAKKLGIVISDNPVENVMPEQQEIAPVEPPQIATSTPVVADKKSIKIAIYNSTQTSGLAAKLKAILVGGGFNVVETSTVTPALSTTTIKIKESLLNSSFAEEIKTLVSSKYQIVSETKGATSTFDVEITIGKK